MSSTPETKATPLGNTDQESQNIFGESAAFIPFTIADNPQLLPLVIGVTGHRDLIAADTEVLRNSVRDVFREIKAKCPHTPLIVLSALAEGADRLVARIACQEFGATLVAPLPMPQEIYAQDCSDDLSRQEFRELLDQAGRVVTLPFVTDTTLTNVADPMRRNPQYEAVGRYIVRHCHILIALWNGIHKSESNTSEVGGTWQVVHLQLHGGSQPGLGPLDPPKRGPVYHIVTPRQNATTTKGVAYQRTISYPPPLVTSTSAHISAHEQESQKVYEAILDRIDKFNQDVANLSPQRRKSVANVATTTHDVWVTLEADTTLSGSARTILRHFKAIDSLAMSYGRKTRVTFCGLFFLAFLALCVFEVCAHLLIPVGRGYPALQASFVLCPILWGVALLLGWRAGKSDYQVKFQDYRALAEGLRVQFCWHVAGLSDAVEDSYLRKQRGDLEWIRYALRTWMWPIRDECQPNDNQLHRNRLPLLRKCWIEDQREYFARAWDGERQKEQKRTLGENLFKVSLVVASLLALILLIFWIVVWYTNTPLFPDEDSQLLIHMFLLLIGILTISAATCVAYVEKMAFAEHARQYRAMSILFGQAHQFDEATAADDRCVEFLRQLGQDALGEHGDWLFMHRERLLEVPIP